MEQFVQVLAAAGVPQEVITELKGVNLEENKDWKPDAVIQHLDTTYRNKLLNNSEFLGSITEDKIPETLKRKFESSQYGRFMEETKRFAGSLGIDLSDLSDQEKTSLKGVLTAAFSKAQKNATPEGMKELQTKLQDTLQQFDSFKTESATSIENVRKEEALKSQTKLGQFATLQTLVEIPELAVKPRFISETVHKMVAAKYTPVFNEETMSYDIMQKNSPTLRALTSAGKEISYKDALLEVMKDEPGLLKEKQQDPPPDPRRRVKVDGEETQVIDEHIRKKMGL